ncbi:MAG: sigma-54 dependent transcriptional regulator [Planctomycetota bacterium]|jgi:DNA-binding NtrC family response regulator|nr:hypothetical protein [Planctomycetota bacterium]MDP6369125.1 sigma-54 dependent transcriptional regulator [Planctomycetota bacterium]MDP6520171.1 sigma-54 dependent transcriptional regulator [Planctomycetota bacterium]MDP6837769.1 sigma-54 dependent transcriptional regulator [Planctomycetota bacterium]MDP6954597.1 sigma-54 dependent transcriptional regulator [Planctomycetota bacterium]
MSIQRILVVDDDSLSREFLAEAVSSLGYQATSAANAQEALQRVASEHIDLVLTDLRMPGMDGIGLIDALRKDHPELPTMLVTAHGSVEAAVQAMRLGAADFLIKPVSPDTLGVVLERVDRTTRLVRENQYLRAEVVGGAPSSMIAESPAMLDMLRCASRIARSKGTVLITGESGTGKERVAHYIHQNSSCANGPFIRVNCAALSEQLLESELFGHEKGAFTGAHKTHVGRFELADEGTILLDEIGEISPRLQAKLLRVLQEEEFERVGGNTTLKVSVRVVATTNRDLAREVEQGRFREDLYYRLHVLPIHLAPLRERPEDIMPLASHFAAHYAADQGTPTPVFTAAACTALEQRDWGGNVRELENVVQRAVVLLQGEQLDIDDLIFGPSTASHAAHALDELTIEDPLLAEVLANNRISDIERIAILATLDSTGGNKTEAARRLGLTARTLSNKLKIWRATGQVA